MARRVEHDTRGIVRPSVAREHFSLERWDPDPPLDRFVDRFWRTAWDLAQPFTQVIVTFPVVNFVFQADGSAVVSGVQRHNDDRRLEGTGWALGVMFRVGGFRPFTDRPMAALVDRRVPAAEVFGPAVHALTAAVLEAPSDERRIGLIEDFLDGLAPDARTPGEDISDLVDAAVGAAPPLTRAADLAERACVSSRTLQRLFQEHVGVGPKAVLDRYRVQGAGEAARRPVPSWAEVAAQFGYADQAHLTADMSRTFGEPPATYSRRERGNDREAGSPRD